MSATLNFRIIPNTNNRYAITTKGQVYSFQNPKRIKELVPHSNGSGYMIVRLKTSKGTYKNFYVHRLVAQAFLPNPYMYPQVNHKDENKSNNNLENLEFCTAKYNANYGTRIQRITETRAINKKFTYDLIDLLENYK